MNHNTVPPTATRQIRAGGKTYFLNLEVTRGEKKPYLKITESRYRGDDEGGSAQYEKQSIYVFSEHIEAFAQAVDEMAKNLLAEPAAD